VIHHSERGLVLIYSRKKKGNAKIDIPGLKSERKKKRKKGKASSQREEHSNPVAEKEREGALIMQGPR